LLRSGVLFILNIRTLVRLAYKLSRLLFFALPLLNFCIKLLFLGFECLAFFFYKKSKFGLFLFNCSLERNFFDRRLRRLRVNALEIFPEVLTFRTLFGALTIFLRLLGAQGVFNDLAVDWHLALKDALGLVDVNCKLIARFTL